RVNNTQLKGKQRVGLEAEAYPNSKDVIPMGSQLHIGVRSLNVRQACFVHETKFVPRVQRQIFRKAE
ncbi:MAG: hypothetical protein WCK17_02700, partial [Verrucomicrobiota bacterium]